MKKINKSKVAILTTVANFELYHITSKYFPKGIQKFVIDGRYGMHGIHSIKYMMKKFHDKEIEWLVMCDEDVVFTDSKIVFSIIEDMIQNSYTVCGIRDGGIIPHRNQNPLVINTFFSILNLKEVKAIWNKREMLTNQYIFENEFEDDLSKLAQEFSATSTYEPYYCFYFWLRRNNKSFLFLDAEICGDSISNTVSYDKKIFMYHTWYARSYGVNEKHTKRIRLIFNKLKINYKGNIRKSSFILWKKKSFFLSNQFKKVVKRVILKFKKND